MSLPAFFPPPQISLRIPREGVRMTVAELCERAGVSCRVSGIGANRVVRLSRGSWKAMKTPGETGEVWVRVPGSSSHARRHAFLALGYLAYGLFDYAARETLWGRPEAQASAGRGRPLTGTAASNAERQRRFRLKKRQEEAASG